ncbi:hypothetical protein AKJ16_DCAP02337 [Drosera capensis]
MNRNQIPNIKSKTFPSAIHTGSSNGVNKSKSKSKPKSRKCWLVIVTRNNKKGGVLVCAYEDTSENKTYK